MLVPEQDQSKRKEEKRMFKLLSEAMLEVHETQRWLIVKCLKIVDAFCVKLINKFGD